MSDSPRAADRPTVFVIEDNTVLREAICRMLQLVGLEFEAYTSGRAFLETYRDDRAGCLLIDYAMPGLNGLEVVRSLRQANLRLPFILLSGSGNAQVQAQAVALETVEFLEKPFDGERLLACVLRALQIDRQRRLLAEGQKPDSPSD